MIVESSSTTVAGSEATRLRRSDGAERNLHRMDRVVGAEWWPVRPAERRRLALLLIAAFAVREAWVLYPAHEPLAYVGGDPFSYLYYGRELAAGRGYRSYVTHEPTAFLPIGYPLFVAVFAWPAQHGLLPDDVPRMVGSAQAILGTVSVLFVWVITRRLFTDRVAAVAAILMAFWPGLILLTASLNVETLFVALLLAALAILVTRAARSDSRRGCWCRECSSGCPPSCAHFPSSSLLHSSSPWRQLRSPGGNPGCERLRSPLPVALVLAPSIARNERELGTMSLSTKWATRSVLTIMSVRLDSSPSLPNASEGSTTSRRPRSSESVTTRICAALSPSSRASPF